MKDKVGRVPNEVFDRVRNPTKLDHDDRELASGKFNISRLNVI